ncbi:MAG: hypothetical protein HYZ91_03795 [Candidatus Omnitrophica bacterium]|nr:hypothetical protein [Candidatus Omnitrophota bacterium]
MDTLKSLWLRVGVAGVLGGLLALLRTNYLMGLIVPLCVAFVRRTPRTLLAATIAVFIMAGLYAPHHWNGYRLTGDWFFYPNARWWANIEFAGQPGWPSKLEMWRDTEGRELKMTPFEYFFGLHTIPELAVGNLRGLCKVVRHMEVVAFHRRVTRATGLHLGVVDGVFQLLGIVGLFLAGFTRRWWMPLMLLCLLAHVVFLYDRGVVEPWRHTYHAFPLMVFGVLLTLAAIGRVGQKLVVR